MSKEALVCGRSPGSDVCDFGAQLEWPQLVKAQRTESGAQKKMLEICPLEMLERSRKC